jgi:hypothetical protein
MLELSIKDKCRDLCEELCEELCEMRVGGCMH